MCDKNYLYFMSNIDNLREKYAGRYVVIKNEAIIGNYASFDEAYNETLKTNELGTFFIQHCTDNCEVNTEFFYSNNVAFA